MKAEPSDRNVIFYASSQRIIHAFRSAARANRSPDRRLKLHELPPDNRSVAKTALACGIPFVMLSHADDDALALANARVEPVMSAAFHLLFTEPGTHPDQIAQWMRTTNIRSEDRLHVVRVEDMQGSQLAPLLGRVSAALGPDTGRRGVIDAYLAGDHLLVRGPKYRMLHVPLDALPALKGQPRQAVRDFTIDPDGSFLEWPALDVHLGWNQFLQAVEPGELLKAQQRTAGFNQRYGAAIRAIREQAGIAQSKIVGLTDRQVRRIENGESRATSGALTTLAEAHGLDLNAYLDEVAKKMA